MILVLLFSLFPPTPQSKPYSSFLYSEARLVLGHFAPKFQQHDGLGYVLYLKTERETGTTFFHGRCGKINAAFSCKQ